MSNKFIQNNTSLIKKINKAGKTILSKKFNSVIEEFVSQFYDRSSPDYLKENTGERLFNAAHCLFKFIEEKKTGTHRKIRVFNPSLKDDGWSSDRTIVETNIVDSPFILDSITQFLFNDDRIIYEVIHPIMSVKRDSKGKITAIKDRAKSKKGDLESVIQIQIGHISTKKELKEIETNLNRILECVEVAVTDWKPMLGKAEDTVGHLENLKKKGLAKGEEIDESIEFIKWATEDNFIFLGYRRFEFNKDKTVTFDEKNQLGIFKAKINKEYDNKINGIPYNSDLILNNSRILEITKSSRKSYVHRFAHMDYVGVKIYNDKGEVIGEERFLGLFTSKVYYQSAHTIPIIRRKIERIIDKSGFRPNSHNGKALMAVLESHPRDELLQSSDNELFEIGMGIVALSEKPDTRVFIRQDRFLRFHSCILFIPRDFFTTALREKIQIILEEELDGKVMDYYTQVTDSPLARVNVLIKSVPDGEASDYLHFDNKKVQKQDIDVSRIQQRIIEKTNSWIDGLSKKLVTHFGEIEGERLFRAYSKCFSDGYKDMYHPGGAASDIVKIEKVYNNKDVSIALSLYFDLYHLEKDCTDNFQLKLFSLDSKINLSDILPIIENLGFNAVDEVTFNIKPKHKNEDIWIHHFKLIFNNKNIDENSKLNLSIDEIKDEFEKALLLIWSKKIENDELNQLVSRSGLNWRDINLLRAYKKYTIQLNFTYSREFITKVLCRHPKISKDLVDFFYAKFNPCLSLKAQNEVMTRAEEKIKSSLNKVVSVAEDRILRQLFETMKATLRTNFFQKDIITDDYKNYISFKLSSKDVPNMPKPVMHAEIFVYGYEVEGIHLRGGKVARGGLRWSDRLEDFRTEVLGLVKAQMTKNAVIVPVGSKGGFVVKHSRANSRNEAFEEGKECYKKYLSGLLDITDNIVNEKIVKPTNVVCHDDDDPYLVVAADKGTATFSDTANGVAKDYGFWLDDAFASGGSVGYDHKKMGITARGAWISVMRVFGNGMLLSKHIKLVGAFNHIHIFVDPNPDRIKSYKERERMFKVPEKANWSDYNKKLISKGGGVFDRSAKTIKVSKEMQAVFDISTSTITPNELIVKMLKAEVDLLWNGGIGTYVKASTESHDQVGDKANDELRINGDELRCKCIGEGGNLGFTQKGRIEYARNGGRINTENDR